MIDPDLLVAVEHDVDALLAKPQVRVQTNRANLERGVRVIDNFCAGTVAVYIVVTNKKPIAEDQALDDPLDIVFSANFASGMVHIIAKDHSFVALSFMNLFKRKCEGVATFEHVRDTLTEQIAAIDAHCAALATENAALPPDDTERFASDNRPVQLAH